MVTQLVTHGNKATGDISAHTHADLLMDAAAAPLMPVHPASESHRSDLRRSRCATPASVTFSSASTLSSWSLVRDPTCESAVSLSAAQPERLSSLNAGSLASWATAASVSAGAPERSRRTSSVCVQMAVAHAWSACANPGSSSTRSGLSAKQRSEPRSSHPRDTRCATTRAAISAGSFVGGNVVKCRATHCTHRSSSGGGASRPSAVRTAGARAGATRMQGA